MQGCQNSDYLKKAIIYQIFLRAFTKDGTLKSAERLLGSLKETGVDIVYLCPICESDEDNDTAFWSERQLAAATENPKNPYRIKNYFKIDEEYGTDEDLNSFVQTAHKLELKVMLDLVYLHCGPHSDLLSMDKEFIKRDENGNPISGQWHFPLLNFESENLREYLYSNMEYFVKKFDIDGYRMDVGDGIPLDFWEEARKRLDKLKPDFIMLNEGMKPEYIESVFNFNYGWGVEIRDVLLKNKTADELAAAWKELDGKIKNNHVVRMFENHDTANDSYDKRPEKILGSAAVEAALVFNYMIDGTPCLYNGNEICDEARHSIFSNRFYGKTNFIDWSFALTEKGIRRRSVLKQLASIHKTEKAIYDGCVIWQENNAEKKILTFVRKADESIFVIINTANEYIETQTELFNIKTELLSSGCVYTEKSSKTNFSLMPYGYAVLKI